MNSVSLVGRLCAEPEMKYTPSEVAVTTFRLAVQRRFKNKDGKYDADFFTVVAWRQTAEFVANYIQKGHLVGVTGSIQTRKYEDKEGQQRTVVEIQAENVENLTPKSDSNGDRDRGRSERKESGSAKHNNSSDEEYDPFSDC